MANFVAEQPLSKHRKAGRWKDKLNTTKVGIFCRAYSEVVRIGILVINCVSHSLAVGEP